LQHKINELRGNDGMINVTPEPPKLEWICKQQRANYG
jgi:hypothetical protein